MKEGFFPTYSIKMMHEDSWPRCSLGKGLGLWVVGSRSRRTLFTHRQTCQSLLNP